jgi:hypothetical protein
MNPEYYQILEKDLKQLLLALNSFTPLEISEVDHFLAAGEYGIAFETLCAIIIEKRKCVPQELRSKIRELAERMDIDSDWWERIVGE